MPLKKAVGAERRMDLASFFCMIGRHGPAVALAVVAVVTVLAGFYIYRTVKGRRRKAACDDGAGSPGGEDRDASVTQHSPLRSEESTDVNTVMEDVGNLRRRPAAAAEQKPPTSPQIQTRENKPAAVFRAAPEEEEVHQSPTLSAAREVRLEESCLEEQEEQEELMEDKRPDDGDASRKTGREEKSPSRDQPAEVEVSARTDEPQPEEEKQGNGPVRDEEDEEEELRHDRTASAGGLRSAPDGASPPVCDLQLSSEPMQKKKKEDDDDDAASSAGVGAESGISSLAVSPDVEADGNVFPANGGEPQTEAASGLSGSSVLSQQLTEVTFASFQSCTQMFHSESIRWTHQQSSAANEDTFGQEIEDSYHSYYDRLETQVSVSEQLDIRSSVTSVQVETHEKTSISVKKKEDSETEVDHERTEISIMEATMDTNEWITDGNAPLLPWMTPAPLHHPQTNQVPPDESSAPEVAPDVPPPTEVPQTGTLFADESMEHYKKVVAVQPMPQNVNVTFRVHYDTQSPYQTVALTGDHPDLGSWKGFVPLEKVEEGHWSAVVSLPADSHVEWKFVLLDKGEVCRWEECRNRLLDTGSGDDVLVHKWWGLA